MENKVSKKYTVLTVILFAITLLSLWRFWTLFNDWSRIVTDIETEQRLLASQCFLCTMPIPMITGIIGFILYYKKGAHVISFFLLALALIAYGVYIFGSLCGLVGYSGGQYWWLLISCVTIPIIAFIILKIYGFRKSRI